MIPIVPIVMHAIAGWTSGPKAVGVAASAAGAVALAAVAGLWLSIHDSRIAARAEERAVSAAIERDLTTELQAHADALIERERQLSAQRNRNETDRAAMEVLAGEKARLRDDADKLEMDKAAAAGVVAFPDRWLRQGRAADAAGTGKGR